MVRKSPFLGQGREREWYAECGNLQPERVEACLLGSRGKDKARISVSQARVLFATASSDSGVLL